MKILREARDLQSNQRKACLAIGVLDGVHLGHQQVIRQTISDARQHDAVAIALTFDRHPNAIVAPERAPALIYSLPQKLRAIQAMGMDATLLIQFTREFSQKSGEDFIRELVRDLGAIHSICVGANFTFGHKRSGNVELLRKLGAELKFQTHGLAALALDGQTVSSTRIRQCIRAGELDDASQMLGRAYAVAQPERAAEHLGLAAHTFRELGARHDLALAEDFIEYFESRAPEEHSEPPATAQLLTLRLAEAVASRELLLRELAAVIQQETRAIRVLIAEGDDEGHTKVVISHGCESAEAAGIAAALERADTDEARESFAAREDARLVMLRPSSAPPATMFVSPSALCSLPGGSPLEPLLRVVELGMDVCALRTRARTGKDPQAQDSLAGASLMPGFIHSSPAMTRLVDEVHKIRSSDVTVLVTGESGTGKELVARAIHALSSRRNKVFVPFNCTAVPKELSEGYLFGYRRGAFTGAINDSAGVIRTAAGGTLFLDEIGDLPLDVQPKILRFLQEGEIQPLGEQRPQKVDVRIIAATNSDLEGMVADGRFREDLYYRLNVIRLRVPPLRERRSEIPTIVNYYINHYSAKFGRRDITITPQTLDILMVCDWPGNVRQLTNEIQRIIARTEDGTVITPDLISPELRRVATHAPPGSASALNPAGSLAAAAASEAISQGLTLADAMADLERRMIADALKKHHGNISRAARELGLTRRGLYLKLGRHDLSASA